MTDEAGCPHVSQAWLANWAKPILRVKDIIIVIIYEWSVGARIFRHLLFLVHLDV